MTLVEAEGRIVVVDTGLMFPTADMLGIDLVLPDFSTLRERADDIEAIVLTHGHEDHVGALPYVLREIGIPPVIYGGLLTSAWSAPSSMSTSFATSRSRSSRRVSRLAPVPSDRAGPHGAFDPRRPGGGAPDRRRHRADHRRLQVRPDPPSTGSPQTSPGSLSSGARACSASAAIRRTPTVRAWRRPSRAWALPCSRSSGAARAGSWSHRSLPTSTACNR